jgi:hypothetical protein
VGRAHVGSSYATPLRVIPEGGQVCENDIHPPSKESCDVLHENVSGSYFANDTGVLRPKTRAGATDPGSLSGLADVLAGEPAAEDVDGGDGGRGNSPDIPHAKHVRPVLLKNSLAERVDLALPHAAHTCALEAEVEPADPGEEASEREVIHAVAGSGFFALSDGLPMPSVGSVKT